MGPDYSNLWIKLIEKGISKKELRDRANISSVTLTKMNKNQNVSLESLVKICHVLGCDIGDIVTLRTK